MKHPKLAVEKRTVIGKKVKKLRKTGITPANIYGKSLPSVAIQIPTKEFEEIYNQVGETGLVDVELDDQTRPVLIKEVHTDPLTQTILHADLYQVNLKEKIKSMVPLVTVGEPKAITDKLGMLLQTLSEVEVEALPEELPEQIEVQVENLAQVDDQVTVGDIKAPQGVAILTDPSQVVAKISELVSEEAKELAAEEAAASEAAKEEGGAESTESAAESAPAQEEATEETNE